MIKKLLLSVFLFGTSAIAQSLGPGYQAALVTAPTSGAAVQFNLSPGHVSSGTCLTMSVTPSTGVTIFYTLDGSPPDEGSLAYSTASCISITQTVNVQAIAVQTTNLATSKVGVVLQNSQTFPNNYKLAVACSKTGGCAPYVSNYTGVGDFSYGNDTKNSNGVTGIPTQAKMITGKSLPSIYGKGTTAEFYLQGQGKVPVPGSQSAAVQALWPYNAPKGTTGGCGTCTSMTQNFYIWPRYSVTGTIYNPSNVENYELDMNKWDFGIIGTGFPYGGASLQCSLNGGGWEYSGQDQNPGWTLFSKTGGVTKAPITDGCGPPFGTITTAINSSQTTFTVSPKKYGTNAATPVQVGSILWVDNELMLTTAISGNNLTVQRGWYSATSSHTINATFAASVHVQYTVEFIPGDTSVCTMPALSGTGTTPVECTYIKSLTLNNTVYDFRTIYGTQVVAGRTVSKLFSKFGQSQIYGEDRIYNQKQLDVASANGGTTANPTNVAEEIDQDDVTASFGKIVGSDASVSLIVP